MTAPEQPCNRILPAIPQLANALILTLALAAMFSATQAASAQTFHLLYQFKSGNDGSQPYANVILDGKGNLYGTTTIDGAYSNGTVFKVSPPGKETVLHSFTGTGGDGAYPVGPLVRDSAGNLYGTTVLGGVFGGACGASGCGIVFKVTPTGKETVLHRFTGSPADGQTPWQGLVRDSAGNLYGTTFQGGANSLGTVFKLDSAGKETVLYSFGPTQIMPDGFAPFGGSLLRDSVGNLYGTTSAGGSQGAGTVFNLDSKGNETILYSFSFSDGYEPTGSLTRDKAGNLYGATFLGGAFNFGTIFKINTAGHETVLHSFSASGGDGTIPGGGLLLDRAGNLYSTTNSGGSSYCGTVFKLDPSGTETILHTFSGTDGRVPDLGLVRDSKGNFYGTAQYGGKFGGGVIFELTP